MLLCSNVLKKQLKTISVEQLPTKEQVINFHGDLLLLRINQLGDVLGPAINAENKLWKESLVELTIYTLSEIASAFPKDAIRKSVYIDLKEKLEDKETSLEEVVRLCQDAGNGVKKIEDLLRQEALYDDYVKESSSYPGEKSVYSKYK